MTAPPEVDNDTIIKAIVDAQGKVESAEPSPVTPAPKPEPIVIEPSKFRTPIDKPIEELPSIHATASQEAEQEQEPDIAFIPTGPGGKLDTPADKLRYGRTPKTDQRRAETDEERWRSFLSGYQTTKFVNIRLRKRDSLTGSYGEAGLRTNCDVNEVRAPQLLIPYRGTWSIGIQPASERLDNDKSWRDFIYTRVQGPEAPPEWALDHPIMEVEVEGMGTISLNDFSSMLDTKIDAAMKRTHPERPPVHPLIPTAPVPPKDDERLERLEKMLEGEREARRAAERRAEDALRQKEVEAVKQEALRQTSEMKAMFESKLNDFATKLESVRAEKPDSSIHMLSTMKDIFGNSTNDRRMEMEREREERRAEREREREERRAEIERRKYDEERMMMLWKNMSEMSTQNSQLMLTMIEKANNNAPAMDAMRMAASSVSDNIKLMATLAHNGLLGGQSKVDVGELVGQGMETLGNLAGAYFASKEQQAKLAGQTAEQMAKQQHVPPPQAFAGTSAAAPAQPPPPPATTPPPQRVVTPVDLMVQHINHGIIAEKKEPEKIASMIADLAKFAEDFDVRNESAQFAQVLDAIENDPEGFLLASFAKDQPDTEYLKVIAKILMQEHGFGPEEAAPPGNGGAEPQKTEGEKPQESPTPAPIQFKRRGRPPKNSAENPPSQP